MNAFAQTLRRVVLRNGQTAAPAEATLRERPASPSSRASTRLRSRSRRTTRSSPTSRARPGAVDIDALELDSPALDALREAGVKLVVPLVSQGELIGLLNLGAAPQRAGLLERRPQAARQPRRAGRAGGAGRPARARAGGRGARARAARAGARGRPADPAELPAQGAARPARLAGRGVLPAGPRGRRRLLRLHRPARRPDRASSCGDVTDKGVPAALVMAATRSILRAAAPAARRRPARCSSASTSCSAPTSRRKMFVTCLYGVLDPATGPLRFANAGHNLPYVANGERRRRAARHRHAARPDARHDLRGEGGDARARRERPALLRRPGRGAQPRARDVRLPTPAASCSADRPAATELIDHAARASSTRFTGPGWEQEDDITLVTLQRAAPDAALASPSDERRRAGVLAELHLPSEPGNEREAMERVAAAVAQLALARALAWSG